MGTTTTTKMKTTVGQGLVSAVVVVTVMSGLSSGAVANAGKAQIEAKLFDSEAALVNTSYFFGIYGVTSKLTPVTGDLVHVRSEGDVNHGCSDYNHDLPDHDWVALVERGNCDFIDKIHLATRRYNASAIIVYDNENTNELIAMTAHVENAVFLAIKQSYGRRLALYTDAGMRVQIRISLYDNGAAPSLAASPLLALLLVWAALFCAAGRFL